MPQQKQQSTPPDFWDQFKQPQQISVPDQSSGADFFDQYRTPDQKKVNTDNSFGTMLMNLLGPTAQNFNPKNAVPIIKALDPTSPTNLYNFAKQVLSPLQKWGQIPSELGQGHLTDAANSFAGGIPILGPTAESATQDINSGEYSKGIGKMLQFPAMAALPEFAAKGIGGAADYLAPRIAQRGLRPTAAVVRDFGGDNGLDLGQRIVDEGLWNPKSQVPKLSKATEDLLQQQVRGAQGTVNGADIAAPAYRYTFNEAGIGSPTADQSVKLGKLDNLFTQHTDALNKFGPINAEDLLNLKRTSGASAAWEGANPVQPDRVGEFYNQGTSLASRDMLDQILQNNGMPSAIDTLGKEQDLMGIQKALDRLNADTLGLKDLRTAADFGGAATAFTTGHPLLGTLAASDFFTRTPMGAATTGIGISKLGNLFGNPLIMQAIYGSGMAGKGSY